MVDGEDLAAHAPAVLAEGALVDAAHVRDLGHYLPHGDARAGWQGARARALHRYLEGVVLGRDPRPVRVLRDAGELREGAVRVDGHGQVRDRVGLGVQIRPAVRPEAVAGRNLGEPGVEEEDEAAGEGHRAVVEDQRSHERPGRLGALKVLPTLGEVARYLPRLHRFWRTSRVRLAQDLHELGALVRVAVPFRVFCRFRRRPEAPRCRASSKSSPGIR